MVPTVFIMIEVDEGNELFLKKKFYDAGKDLMLLDFGSSIVL